jgi:hypothetical protein
MIVLHGNNCNSFVASSADNTDMFLCCAIRPKVFLGDIYNIAQISSTLSSARVFCVLLYCVEWNMLSEFSSHIGKLLACLEQRNQGIQI